jgi:hypothetical protein
MNGAPVIVINEFNGIPLTVNPLDCGTCGDGSGSSSGSSDSSDSSDTELPGATGGVGAVTLIPNLVFASIDAPSTTPDLVQNTIPPATNSFEKWLKVLVASPAPNTLTNVKLVFSQVAPVDSIAAASLSVLYGIGADYPQWGPTDMDSTVAVRPTWKVTVPLDLDNVEGATSLFITLQLQASLGAQPGAFVFPADFMAVVFDWT